jgi:SAM-dependent MidA family methyltransferase
MAVKRLIDPKQMGSLFKVLTVTNENWVKKTIKN